MFTKTCFNADVIKVLRWGKGKGKDKWVKGVDDEEATGEEAQADDGQQQDEGGSVWDEDDVDCGWAIDDEDDDDVHMLDHRRPLLSPERRRNLGV